MRKLSILMSVLFLMAVLVGCSNDEKSNEGDLQVLRMHLNQDPSTFDPALNSGLKNGSILRQLFDGLVRLDENDKPVESVASNIDVSDDKLTYTFTLRESKWSNGDPVTANDFAYAWLRILTPETGSGVANIFYPIENAEKFYLGEADAEDVGIKVLEDLKLEVTLGYPTPYFLELLTGSQFTPLNQKVVEGNAKWADDPSTFVSNGPFNLVSYKIKDEVILEKSDTYWDKDVVKLDKVEYILIEDSNTALDMFNAGELDWIGAPLGGLPGESLKPLLDDGKLNSKSSASMTTAIFHLNREPFSNEKIRKAFGYAINREDITKHVLQGGQKPALGLFPETMLVNPEGYYKDHDVEEAKKLLAEGMKELGISEFPEITFLYNTSDMNHKVAQTLQAQIKEALGIEIALEHKEAKVFFDVQFEATDHHFSMGGWTADYNDPIDFLQCYLSEEWINPEYQDLLDQIRVEADTEKRNKLMYEAEKLMMDEMPLAPLFSGSNSWVKNDNVKGINVSSITHIDLKHAFIEK